MTKEPYDANPAGLLKSLLDIIENAIVPLTSQGVSKGNKLFGAAILSKKDLSPITIATNNETASPLLHGEINCIQQFFAQDFENGKRPSPRDCVFVATHEPCSLCLSGITWSGFDNFFHLFTYEDSRDLFAIPYDIDILQAVFRVPAVSTTITTTAAVDENLDARPLYNKRNKFFTARSFADLVLEIRDRDGETEAQKWDREVARVKDLYNGLSDTYQKGKTDGVDSASFFK